MIQTRDQKLVADILPRVQALPESQRKSYGSMAHKLPVLIRSAGLAQALAYIQARGNEGQLQLLSDLTATLNTMGHGSANRTLLEQVQRTDLGTYMLLTKQALNTLLWYKRFAQTVLDVQATDDGSTK